MTAGAPVPMPPVGVVAERLRALGALHGTAPPFDTATVADEPTVLFLDWLDEAVRAGVEEPHAATLATIGADGIPDARTLLLKDVSAPAGWAVAAPRSSRKAAQLAANPVAALNFWWQPLLRAVRVRGTVAEATREEVATDLAARPTKTGLSAEDWMLWWIRPIRIEFWQGATSRDHLRLVYERRNGAWTHDVLGRRKDGKSE